MFLSLPKLNAKKLIFLLIIFGLVPCLNKKETEVAMSLSDLFCVERHKDEFISLIKNYVNILFGNDQEVEALLNGQAKEKISSIVEIAVVTNGPKGANIFLSLIHI